MGRSLIGKVQSPALPEAPRAIENRSFFSALNNVIRLFFNGASNAINQVVGENGGRFIEKPYALYFDVSVQPLVAVNTAQKVEFDTTYLENRFSINGATRTELTVDYSGIYNFQFTAQVRSNSASAKIIYLWIRRNGTNIGYSTREYRVAGALAILEITWAFIIDLQAGDNIEMMWTGNDIDMFLEAEAPTSPHVGIPSAVMAIIFVSPLPDVLPTPPSP